MNTKGVFRTGADRYIYYWELIKKVPKSQADSIGQGQSNRFATIGCMGTLKQQNYYRGLRGT